MFAGGLPPPGSDILKFVGDFNIWQVKTFSHLFDHMSSVTRIVSDL